MRKDYSSMKYQDLYKEVRDLGINPFGKKKTELIKIMENAYDESVPLSEVENVGAVETDVSEDNEISKFMKEQKEFNNKIMQVLEKVSAMTTPPSQPVAMEVPSDDAMTTSQAVEEKEQSVKSLEPRVFTAGVTGAVEQVALVGGAPEDLTVNQYLDSKGMSFADLENAVLSFLTVSPARRDVTIDSITRAEQEGIAKAKEIVESGVDKVTLTDVYVSSALNNVFGWVTKSIVDGTCIMAKPE